MYRALLLAIPLAAVLTGCTDRGPLGPNAETVSSLASHRGGEHGATTTVTEQTIPIFRTPFAACLGETLTVTGTRSLRTRVTIDATGGMHVQMLFNDRGWTAVGQTSGKSWTLVAGMAPLSANFSGHTPVVTFTWAGGQVFKPDDPSMPVLLFNGPTHFTVNARGEVTVDFDKYEFFICRGGGA